ncbi:cysteine synthase [Rhodomicrobium vannielii ATCC 17100]|uniref:cysteine synthase n=1 Tax=Rhodomicrobium vannielii (strain ATCC 17100 / DSM 162 / LMG 4299 / NCIMB 10020 / ATH 3.1.1) TaxID=648757 RepID=E3I4V8_RHOVT|nr:cysteine synthase A [Rhodomicrobium vannielii]ADP72780.1 cysteine synthase [Rhodomicrobium vannielii ATCC 17100]
MQRRARKRPAQTRWGRGHIYKDITGAIGNTPLVQINAMAEAANAHATLLAKLEFMNPLASVKDRIALAMIEAAEAEGRIVPGESVLIEPTSGNTGIALAFVAAVKRYRLIVVAPESMSVERRKMLSHLGAEIQLTPAALGMTGALSQADALAARLPEAVILQQFSNPANPTIHAMTTAEEIWADTDGAVDVVVAGVGTGGTLTGCARVLRPRKQGLQVIAVEPEASSVLSGGSSGSHGLQGIGPGFIPAVLDQSLIDEVLTISNETAYETARQAAKLEGLPIGISSGAALAAGLKIAARPRLRGKTVVVIIPSSAERELSTPLFESTSRIND